MQCNFNEGDKLDAHRPLPITVLCGGRFFHSIPNDQLTQVLVFGHEMKWAKVTNNIPIQNHVL